jgi:pilus assembly protein CpaE
VRKRAANRRIVPPPRDRKGALSNAPTRLLNPDILTAMPPAANEPERQPQPPPPDDDLHQSTVIQDVALSQLEPVESQAVEARPTAERVNLGTIVVFFGSHGGTGASTLAANAATLLARKAFETCLVDLDLQLGDALTMLGLEPRCPTSKLAREMDSFDWDMLAPMLPRHASGTRVVSQVGAIEELADLSPGRIPTVLRYLQERFRYVLVDGVRDFNDFALGAMDVADRIVMVVTQDVPSVRGASRRLALFSRLGYPASKIRVVVNRHSKQVEVTLDAVSNALGRVPMITVANDFPMVQGAVNQGVPVGDIAPASTVAVDLERMTHELFGLPGRPPRATRTQGRGFWSRLFKRG